MKVGGTQQCLPGQDMLHGLDNLTGNVRNKVQGLLDTDNDDVDEHRYQGMKMNDELLHCQKEKPSIC